MAQAQYNIDVTISGLCSGYTTPGILPAYEVQSGDTMTGITDAFYDTDDPNAIDLLCNWNCFLASATIQPGWIIQLPAALRYMDANGNCHEYLLEMIYVDYPSETTGTTDSCIQNGYCCRVFSGTVGNTNETADWETNGLDGVGIGLNYPSASGWGQFGCMGSEFSCCP